MDVMHTDLVVDHLRQDVDTGEARIDMMVVTEVAVHKAVADASEVPIEVSLMMIVLFRDEDQKRSPTFRSSLANHQKGAHPSHPHPRHTNRVPDHSCNTSSAPSKPAA